MENLTKINNLNLEELNALNEEITANIYGHLLGKHLDDALHEANFNDEGKFVCHHCGGSNTFKAGFTPQGKQRYYCEDCKKKMIMGRGYITFSSKKKEAQWCTFIQSMFDGDALQVSAEKANISKRTSFRWRQKVLFVLNQLMNKEVLDDTVHLDETLYPVVHKNKNKEKEDIPKKRGMSSQKVNVTCALDTNGNTILKVVDRGRVTSDSLIKVYDGMIKKGCIVVSDSLRSYHKLMKHLEIDWKKIPSKKKSLGEYTLEPINSLHALLKDFTYKYKGISIKYLQGYLALFDFQRKHPNHHKQEVFQEMILKIFTTLGHLKSEVIDSNCNIYA